MSGLFCLTLFVRFIQAVTCSYRLFISLSMPLEFIHSSTDGLLGNINSCCYECSGSFALFRTSSFSMCLMTILSKIMPLKDYFECICKIIIIDPLLVLI